MNRYVAVLLPVLLVALLMYFVFPRLGIATPQPGANACGDVSVKIYWNSQLQASTFSATLNGVAVTSSFPASMPSTGPVSATLTNVPAGSNTLTIGATLQG